MTINSFLRSLIRQICAFEVELPQVVKSFCSQHRTSGQQPSPKSLISLLHAVIDVLQSETFIIADALDEYPESERKELLSILRFIIDHGCKDMHILVTSRNEQDIAHTFDKMSTEIIGLDSSIVDEDIRLHVRSCLLDDSKLSRLPDHMKQEIEDRLGKDAHGMLVTVFFDLAAALPRIIFSGRLDARSKTEPFCSSLSGFAGPFASLTPYDFAKSPPL